ncbi:MAG: hypothetical protein GY854_05575 [Deltaproteobacteria bacterium]|nr:hypothetical protein [Deltaproteobacteria bacterium]
MRIGTTTATLLLVAFAMGACGEEMEAISQITKFRVMGVQADPPEIRPGQGTTLRVLFADPKGAGRDVTIMWLTCAGSFSPSADLAEGECEPIWMPGFGTAAEGADAYEIPFTSEDILDELPEDEEYLSVTTIVVLCAGGELPGLDDMEVNGEIESFDDLCRDGDGLVAVKSFRISNSTNPNKNPVIDKVVFNESQMPSGGDTDPLDAGIQDAGTPEPKGMDAGPGSFGCTEAKDCMDGATIQAYLTQTSFQNYDKKEFGETITTEEDPYISWFVTGGKFTDDRSRTSEPPGPFEVDWRPPREGGQVTLWAVAHDMRGGISWETFIIDANVDVD